MRPARYALRPASTPRRKPSAIREGSWAWAMAVFTSTASAPTSMTCAASEGTARPASTTTGTCAFSMIIWISSMVKTPRPEPMGEPRGMTVAPPRREQRLLHRATAGGVGQDGVPAPVDVVKEGLLVGVVEVQAADGDG